LFLPSRRIFFAGPILDFSVLFVKGQASKKSISPTENKFHRGKKPKNPITDGGPKSKKLSTSGKMQKML